jgi:large subunit ribosomal protein L12
MRLINREVKKMEYIYAGLLLHKAGQEINEANVKKVIDASGAKADDARVKALIAALDGVDIDEAITKAAPVAAAAPAAAPASGESPAEEAKEKEEDEKVNVEEAASGLSGLFG